MPRRDRPVRRGRTGAARLVATMVVAALLIAGCGNPAVGGASANPAVDGASATPAASDAAAANATAAASTVASQAATPTAPPPASTPLPSITPAPSPAKPGFLATSGSSFALDGAPFTFSGFDIYQANSRVNCSSTMGTGPALDRALTAIGPTHRVFRAWFFQYLATTNGRRDWSAFDHTLAVAAAHGDKVIVTLGNEWGSCESRRSVIKTVGWYESGYRTEVLPGTTVPYRAWVAEVVARYAHDPTVAMWQLMNEAETRVDGSACGPASVLRAFAADVSSLVKKIDPDHLLNVGTGGDQCGARGSDYASLYGLPTVDVCEYHDYGHDATPLPDAVAADIAACEVLGKPIFAGEVGIRSADAGGPRARADELLAKARAQVAAGAAGFLVWSWNDTPRSGSYEVGPGDPLLAATW